MDISSLTIKTIQEGFRKKTFSCVEVTKAYLDRIEAFDAKIKAFITVDASGALHQAVEADKKYKEGGPRGELCGIPVAIKDCFCTQGLTSTNGSKMLQTYVPAYDATVVKKLKEQGVVILGKTNTDEFTMGASTENSAFGPTFNPYDTSRVAGGSSGGSAAAVSAGFAPFALGTDTGGSIRQPANFCGVTGLKNTYGLVSRYGVMSMASSLDTIGPITKTVEDAAIVMDAIAGHDDQDATTRREAPDFFHASLNHAVKGLTIGLPKEYFIKGTDPRILASIEQAIEVLKEQGIKVKEVSLPHTKYALPVYYVICPAEVSSNMSRYDGMRFGLSKRGRDVWEQYKKTRQAGLGEEVKRRIMLGTFVLSSGYVDAYYNQAQKVRTLIRQDFEAVFKKVDALITPVSPTVPFRVGENAQDPLQMYLADIFSVAANVAGICGLSIPCGQVQEEGKDLPIGMQIMTGQWQESTALRLGHAFQQVTTWHTHTPSLKT